MTENVYRFTCSFCGEKRIGKTSIGGYCADCGKQICYQCWQINKHHNCAEHTPETVCCYVCNRRFNPCDERISYCKVCGKTMCSRCYSINHEYCPDHQPKQCAQCKRIINHTESVEHCRTCNDILCESCFNKELPFCKLHLPPICGSCGKYMYDNLVSKGTCVICKKQICADCWDEDQERCSNHAVIECGLCGKLVDKSVEYVDNCSVQNCKSQICKICAVENDLKYCRIHLPNYENIVDRSEMINLLRLYFNTVYNQFNIIKGDILLSDNKKYKIKDITKNYNSYNRLFLESINIDRYKYPSIHDSDVEILLRNDSYSFPDNSNPTVRVLLYPVLRVHRYFSPGFDREPISLDELASVLKKEINKAPRKIFNFLCFISPVGFSETAIDETKNGKLYRDETSEYCLVDISKNVVYFRNHSISDKLHLILRGLSKDELIDECIRYINERFNSNIRTRLSAMEIADETSIEVDIVKLAFLRIEKEQEKFEICKGEGTDLILSI
ncbi:MAG: hypothetical protein A2161_19040 [Candidatus Schekmanbacteria bacterium RBG_13_48_7]|uniref:B box-type domain-containing protein n=1 Tax=Candidatus Schekmanbacteria bacterium RBG_13_48_7 TaxID=1817878 RepID=A0A1F7RRV3_9BACT|nr:MAG: hypothetical protein A2161_19040 [Candidatus Schekmanbacteria bacterium RBG_13_48_7]